ncbi:hypothetical protein F5890DRAFT_1451684 [Lentinula detonsa]|uniref:Uncharacterized protein n=1 Tax=Lentinula detonsa TaxID=2804962 RepID=A0AA38UYB0_9AGAR|nr:hypothetical protein F5890DRAFT_1451684 [Lentinula detonsa]
MTQNSAEEQQHAIVLLYNSGHVIAVIPQTFAYGKSFQPSFSIGSFRYKLLTGIYAVFFSVSSYVMFRRGLATLARKALFGISIFMFLMSTIHWTASIVTLIRIIQVWFLALDPDAQKPPNFLPLFNVLILVNFFLSDGVVVWRAWVLCSVDGTKILMMCLFMLGLVFVSVIATIAFRITLMVSGVVHPGSDPLAVRFTQAINVTQVATLVLSLSTNLLATFLISLKAWKSRIEIRNILNSSTDRQSRAGKIFALLIETGVMYSVSCLMVLVSSLIPLKGLDGTVGDLYTPLSAQLAGIYPIVVLLLISHSYTLDRTVRAFSSGLEQFDENQIPIIHSGPLETMRFRVNHHRESVIAAGHFFGNRSDDSSRSDLNGQQKHEHANEDGQK